MNMNEFAVEITKEEGKIKSLPIAQVKEVLRLTMIKLAWMKPEDVTKLLNRYRKSDSTR